MLILDKQLALERMVTLAERLRERVPEPFSTHGASFMAMPPPAAAATPRLRRWRDNAPRSPAAPAPVPAAPGGRIALGDR